MSHPKQAVKVPLSTEIKMDTINFNVITEGFDVNIGSVSIPQFIVINGGLGTFQQWITLFENNDDDEYDGEMGLNDDEAPMIQVKFETKQEQPERVISKVGS
jgi:hypothetical protein